MNKETEKVIEALTVGIRNGAHGIDGVSHILFVRNISDELSSAIDGFNVSAFVEACTQEPKGPLTIGRTMHQF